MQAQTAAEVQVQFPRRGWREHSRGHRTQIDERRLGFGRHDEIGRAQAAAPLADRNTCIGSIIVSMEGAMRLKLTKT